MNGLFSRYQITFGRDLSGSRYQSGSKSILTEFVIPAQAGIQSNVFEQSELSSKGAGMTAFEAFESPVAEGTL